MRCSIKNSAWLSFVLMLILGSTSCFSAETAKPMESVSIYQLISSPEQFDGHRVSVIGVFSFGLDSAAIYPSVEYFNEDIFPSSIAVEIPKSVTSSGLLEISKLEESYVMVKGTFNAKDRGHSGFCAGAIEDTEEISVWTSK